MNQTGSEYLSTPKDITFCQVILCLLTGQQPSRHTRGVDVALAWTPGYRVRVTETTKLHISQCLNRASYM